MSMLLFKYLSRNVAITLYYTTTVLSNGGISEYKEICQREIIELFQFKLAKIVYRQLPTETRNGPLNSRYEQLSEPKR